jgi:hypothetical protein
MEQVRLCPTCCDLLEEKTSGSRVDVSAVPAHDRHVERARSDSRGPGWGRQEGKRELRVTTALRIDGAGESGCVSRHAGVSSGVQADEADAAR